MKEKLITKVLGTKATEKERKGLRMLLDYFDEKDLKKYDKMLDNWYNYLHGGYYDKKLEQSFEEVKFACLIGHYDPVDMARTLALISKQGCK